MYYIPTVTSEFEKFNFEDNKQKYTKTELGVITDTGSYKGFTFELEITTNNYNIVRNYSKLDNGKIQSVYELIYYNNSPFMIRKDFYANGNIKQKGLYIIHGDYYKGTWYYYNEKGDLTNSIDNDVFFKYTWEDLSTFMKENDIQISLGKPKGENILTRIYSNPTKLFPESSIKEIGQVLPTPLWTITWRKPTRPQNEYTEVSLDGTTGKMGYRKKYTVAEEPGDEGTEEIEYFDISKDKK